MRMYVAVFIIVILQILTSSTMPQETVSVLVPAPNSPFSSGSGVTGSLQCTKNSGESYAVCASWSDTAIKYNLHPFSFAAKGPNQGNYMRSCDLYETASQSTSRAVCVKGNVATNGTVYFHNISDMINITNVSIGVTGSLPYAIVDTPNQIAYVSNFHNILPAIFKITNIGGSSPIVAGNLTSFGSGDYDPAAMLIIDGFLYVHFSTSPARLARINITTFTWNQTFKFSTGENTGLYDNLADDDNFIYDLTYVGILVRCTYKNNNFARFDSLNTGFTETYSLAISPESSFLLFTADYSGIVAVTTSSFSVHIRALLPNPTSAGYVQAFGCPIILSTNNNTNSYPVCAFSYSNDYLYIFNFAHVPFREAYPTIYPLPSSPINTSSSVLGSVQCTKNSGESYAVCASFSNTAIKYNLQPFSFAVKGPNQGSIMNSCDLYETASQSTSRALCAKSYGGGTNGIVYFHRVSDMINVTNITIGSTANSPHVIVDTPNQVAYVSNNNNPPAIFKMANIGSNTPIVAGNLTSFGFGDYNPAAMLIIDGFLYVHFFMAPARLARINISTFVWNKTTPFESGEDGGFEDNVANDDNFIYDLTEFGILVRCTYKNNNFARFDSLNTGLSSTYSLAISPDQRTLFVVSQNNGVLQMVGTKSFSLFGNIATVPSAFGRPIITNWCNVYAFSSNSDSVYAFRLNSSTCQTQSAELSASLTVSISIERTTTNSGSGSISESESTSRTPTVTSSNTKTISASHSSSGSNSVASSASTSISCTNSFTSSISTSASQSLSISNSNSLTSTSSPSFTSSYSSTDNDCPRMWNQSTCDRPDIPCMWCENIGACVNTSESCSTIHCNYFSTVASTIDNNLCPSSECHYCSKRKTCLNKTHDPTCSCVVASSSSDCAALGECFWCNTNISFFEQPPNSVNLCIDSNNEASPESQECNCAFYPQHICNQTSSPCEWCDAVNSCIDPRLKTCEDTRCTDFTPLASSGKCPSPKCGVCRGICVGNEFVGENCNPSKFDEITCRGCHNCSWNLPIVLGVSDSDPYCVMSASPLNCESPPTCNGINSNEKEKRNQCESSGCKFDADRNLCANQDCFDFFLPGFLLQPFALTVFGFVKDFIVLLLIGVFGDSLMRFIRRRIIVPFSFWRNNWDRNKIIPNLGRTIYVNDSKCRDDNSERNESFEKYCERIMNELFEFPSENNDEGASNVSFNGSSIQDEKHESENWKIKSKVLDAVAFSMYDSGLWFDLDDDGYCGITNSAATLSGYSETLLSEDERVAENIGDRMSHDDDEQKNENQIEKVALAETIIDNRVNLQKIVTVAITARATAVVFYASSRDPKTRAAAALNSFSSPMQLLFYLCGVFILVIAAFYTVLGNQKNLAIVNRISSYSCGDTSSLTSNSTSTSEIISAERRATFFLLGFRLMNSSTLATVMLLFVKTVRAIWASFRDRFFVMNLPQRLPIMSLYTKRSSQLLLLFYFLGVLPFALAGITYGLQVTGSVIVCLIAIVLLVLDTSILTVVRSITAKKEKEELAAARKKILDEELEAHALNSEKETFSQVDDDFEVAKSQCVINNNDNDDILPRSSSNYNKRNGTPRHNNDNKEQENETKSAQPFRINSGKFRSEIILQKMYGVDALPADGVENKGGWDEITADEALTTKRNSLTEAAPTTLVKALLVFILSEELPTIILTLALQMCFNYMCLMEYKSSFGVNDQSEVPQLEFNSRKLVCVAQLFAHDVSAYINVFSSFFAYL